MSNWTAGAVGDLFDLITGYAFKSRDFIPSGVPVIKIKNVKSGYFSEHEFSYVDPSFLETLRDKVAKQSDLLISMSGNRHDGSPETWVGKIAILKRTGNYLINQRVGALRPRKEVEIDVRFFSFLLSSIPYQELFISIATSSGGQANLSPQQIFSASVRYPDLKTQQQIGALLGALDDKIDLNRRMNETLEAITRAIFNDWFFDFGPTRAKTEGRPPYLAPEIWDLFPDALDDEDKPVGWKQTSLSELVEFNPKEPLPRGVVAPYLAMNALPTNGAIPGPPIPRAYKSGTRFRSGDTLFARITPCLENGKTCFVQQLPSGTVGWGSTEYIVMRAREPLPACFTYLMARDTSFRTHAIQSMTGTSGRQRARAEALERFSFCQPDKPLWKAFASIVELIFQKIAANGYESQTLAETRDLLLPKLMSGKIRLREAAKAVEAVA